MTETTPRHALPLIAPGQAQKELAHNEAIVALDLMTHPFAEAVGIDTPPADPVVGRCWIVGVAPTGAWAGQAGALAGWTDAGWRFVAAREGMTVATGSPAGFVRRTGTEWQAGVVLGSEVRLGGQRVVGERRPAIAGPAGGAVVDVEARAALEAVLATLREHGLIAG